MLDILKTGGFLIWPILLASLLAVAIVLDRFWALRSEAVAPADLVDELKKLHQEGRLNQQVVEKVRQHSPLGQILAAGLQNMNHSREVMKEAIEETGRVVVLRLERYLNTLGTIAAITPLLGLLGTVFGMIEVFSAITSAGVGDPNALAGGISKALITTAAGLSVGIPALMFHRYFTGRVTELVIHMEQEAMRLVEIIHGERS